MTLFALAVLIAPLVLIAAYVQVQQWRRRRQDAADAAELAQMKRDLGLTDGGE